MVRAGLTPVIESVLEQAGLGHASNIYVCANDMVFEDDLLVRFEPAKPVSECLAVIRTMNSGFAE